ncbi:hypothetical protein FB567DRAFT_601187 [Paraphoma chrysanthemicola]|uniref:MYND-type domain-containing protein n=1 Tax=Paraphoma chrysanthemicola TaxID=798071 RepID=A0A8K0RLF1_9PLEO|nr:hypothetical protein FB567DRAFT_601187 [Paraphoma chrysanthemicola]
MPDLSDFLDPPLCANTDRRVGDCIVPCTTTAKFTCKSCKLIQYCSKECQTLDWILHKPTCKSPLLKDAYEPSFIAEKRLPLYMTNVDPSGLNLAPHGSMQYLWGNIPALDIINLVGNEGEAEVITHNISLLFAATGDLRNVLKTVAGLPEKYGGQCLVVMNDWNFTITARNVMMLLTAFHFEPKTAVPIIIHLWYSALLPKPILDALETSILPYILDVCDKIKDKSKTSLQAKTFKLGDRTLRLVLKQEEWFALAKMFKVPEAHHLTAHQAQSIRQSTLLAPSRIDYVEKAFQSMTPGRRACAFKFRADGLLLPFGASRKEFAIPNPTFFQEQGLWPMKDDSDPLDGWSYTEYMTYASGAKNDMYGALFNLLRVRIAEFCDRLKACNINFQMFATNAIELPRHIKDIQFDRIEVSNICDRGYIGIADILATFSPMLKPKTKNPYATILALFLNAVREEERYDLNAELAATPYELRRIEQLRSYMDLSPAVFDVLSGKHSSAMRNVSMADVQLANVAADMFGDFDLYFEKFSSKPDKRQAGSMNQLARINGMQVKAKQTIIERWPYRVKEETTKEQFKILLSESTSGHERYVEFEKAELVSQSIYRRIC